MAAVAVGAFVTPNHRLDVIAVSDPVFAPALPSGPLGVVVPVAVLVTSEMVLPESSELEIMIPWPA